jgi:hypothetical protein
MEWDVRALETDPGAVVEDVLWEISEVEIERYEYVAEWELGPDDERRQASDTESDKNVPSP